MSEGNENFDQTSAIFGAMSSFFWRVVFFFLCCWVGHYVGVNSTHAAEMFQDIWVNGPGTMLQYADLNPFFVPLDWLWSMLDGISEGWGVLQLIALAVGFLFVWLSEDNYIHGLAIAAGTQPIASFLVEGTSGAADLVVGIISLIVWEGTVLFFYWWCWKHIE